VVPARLPSWRTAAQQNTAVFISPKEKSEIVVEVPGFSPAKAPARKSGFSLGGPGLKPVSLNATLGTAEAVPFHRSYGHFFCS
jgi:hypothetical protein